jgi:hypothetical protein
VQKRPWHPCLVPQRLNGYKRVKMDIPVSPRPASVHCVPLNAAAGIRI